MDVSFVEVAKIHRDELDKMFGSVAFEVFVACVFGEGEAMAAQAGVMMAEDVNEVEAARLLVEAGRLIGAASLMKAYASGSRPLGSAVIRTRTA